MIAYREDKGTGKNFTMKKVLLSDIARECGLSVSTVSRVLSGDDSRRIRQETRDLIYRKADELGYIRERISRLSKKESIRVATLFLSDHESLPSPFFSEIIDGIKTASASYPDADISFTLLSLYDSDFYRNFSEGGFDIAIILGRVRKDVLRRIRESGVQLIYAGLNGIEGMDQVISDARSGCAAAVAYLASQGRKRIAFMGPAEKQDLENEYRYEGYLEGLKRCGIPFDSSLVEDCYLSAEEGREKAARIIASRPDAIICANDNLALGVIRLLQDRGISIPGEIAVTGFDNIEASAYLKPSLTTFDVPKQELGRFALKAALDRRRNPRDYSIRIELPFRLIERESTKEDGHV